MLSFLLLRWVLIIIGINIRIAWIIIIRPGKEDIFFIFNWRLVIRNLITCWFREFLNVVLFRFFHLLGLVKSVINNDTSWIVSFHWAWCRWHPIRTYFANTMLLSLVLVLINCRTNSMSIPAFNWSGVFVTCLIDKNSVLVYLSSHPKWLVTKVIWWCTSDWVWITLLWFHCTRSEASFSPLRCHSCTMNLTKHSTSFWIICFDWNFWFASHRLKSSLKLTKTKFEVLTLLWPAVAFEINKSVC